MRELTATLNMITPLWTGGSNSQMDRVHVTGILGSLRWWYEALVRGVGGEACDPRDHTCIYTSEEEELGLCYACRLFGTTGWARRFQLASINDGQAQGLGDGVLRTDPTIRPGRKGNGATWYIGKGSQPHAGKIELHMMSALPAARLAASSLAHSASRADPEVVDVVGRLMQFVGWYGGLGAKPQLGLGRATISFSPALSGGNDPLVGHLRHIADDRKWRNTSTSRPSLRHMFLAEIQAKNNGLDPNATVNLKYDLRALFRANPDQLGYQTLRHYVMGHVPQGIGSSDKERIRSKVMVSQPLAARQGVLGNRIRIWGCIPPELTFPPGSTMPSGPTAPAGTPGVIATRDRVITSIHTHLTTNYTVLAWREMNVPSRDTTALTDPLEFLSTLLTEVPR